VVKPNIQRAVQLASQKAFETAEITTDEVLGALKRLLHRNIKKYFNDDGHPKKLSDISDEDAAMISGVEVIIKNAMADDGASYKVLKIKLDDRATAFDILTRHLHIGDPTVNVMVDDAEFIARLQASKLRAAEAERHLEAERKKRGR
jgi:hypothetical protein